MPLTLLKNRETVHVDIPSSKEITDACVAKNTIINATLIFGDHLDPWDDVTFPVTINETECKATIATSLDGLASIDFLIADASLPNDTEDNTYIFSLKRNEAKEWEVGEVIVLVHDTEAAEDFFGLLHSEQLRLLGF